MEMFGMDFFSDLCVECTVRGIGYGGDEERKKKIARASGG